MAHVVVLGAGLGGTIMAYELRDELAKEHKVSVVNNGSHYSFVPSNPWVAVGWRDKAGGRGRSRSGSGAARHRVSSARGKARPSGRTLASNSTTAHRSPTTIW